MNIKQAITFAAIAFAGTAAFADDITIVQDNFVAQKTRAEVKAELAQARADGTLPKFGDSDFSVPMASGTPLTREQVRADLRSTPKLSVMTFNPAA